MDGILFLLLLLLGGLLANMRRRVAMLEREQAELRGEIARMTGPSPQPRAMPATTVADRSVRTPTVTPPPVEQPAAPPEPLPTTESELTRFDFETLVGGRLPIWIGGAALVLAGFFLVRVAIDSGLIGPAVRATLAGLFALLLIAASEVARRLPATRDDPRVGQVLAGAGIASAYGTLYLVAAIYRLVAPLPAFVMMLAITGAALGLAIRQGPPTAVMALLGGFAAPLVAGYDAAGLGALLTYLGLFIAALFGLARNRGWTWLTVAAALAGFGWVNFLAVVEGGDAVSSTGLFVVALAIATTLALPATGARWPWLRVAPLVAGLVQLFVFAPVLAYDALAWGFHLVLVGAALLLGWRDRTLLPAAVVAAALTVAMIALTGAQPQPGMTLIIAAVATLILAVPGLLLSRSARPWALIATIGLAGPVLAAHGASPSLLPLALWSLVEAVAALLLGWLSWRHRDRAAGVDAGLLGGALGAVACGVTALAGWFGVGALGSALALAMLGLHAWARRTGAPALLPALAAPFAAAAIAATLPALALIGVAIESLFGDRLSFAGLPPAGDVLRYITPPAGMALAIAILSPVAFGRFRRIVVPLAVIGVAATLYVLAKQPLAIDTPERFLDWGFIERALITQALLLGAWLLARAGRARRSADTLLVIGLARIAWFDLLLLNPVAVEQAVGSLPLLNAAVLHPALAALVCWRWPNPGRRVRIAAMVLTLAAALALVRQVAHGTLLTGPVGVAENWGYSAAMLILSALWLWRGIVGGARELRYAGLGLALIVSLKVFTIDVAFEGLLRVVSFLGIGVALIAISWVYTRFVTPASRRAADSDPPPDRAPA
ncbi:DUF2339 domain-containing protein [Sphingomonas baiyangensis]|uniref:DUF2339 domain-containing protein n=1 Tax=Sphingomonas baiyangensis TaxID=2572576 RepID=A0A4U1L7W7_9SPHN|nr:DUF2339 domain-containing protein [Sphingomonas baiyangensis]TKD53047.1 DUF2339 domain-containing protein [Sphingomonas baiyangensis]